MTSHAASVSVVSDAAVAVVPFVPEAMAVVPATSMGVVVSTPVRAMTNACEDREACVQVHDAAPSYTLYQSATLTHHGSGAE